MNIRYLPLHTKETTSLSQSETQTQHQNHRIQSIPYPRFSNQSFGSCPTKSIPNFSSWSHYIRNCVSQGAPKEALLAYTQIHNNGNYVLGLVPLVLKACASFSLLQYGKVLHAQAFKNGVDFDIIVGTSLINMYAKCGDTGDSRKVFEYMPQRNVVTYNAMIGGFVRNGDIEHGALLFEQMPERTSVSWIEMIDGYARRGDLVMARQFFDRIPPELRNVVTWTVLVDGYASNGNMEAAREVFEAMPQRNFFVWSSMISGYFKKGDAKEAKAIFDRIPVKNMVNWNSLISGYTQNGLCEQALDSFAKMQVDGFEPDEVTLASALSACAQLGLLDVGKELHQMIVHRGIKLNQFILNGLIDMYAKCGDLSNARLIFEGMTHKNDACWNAMISGFAIHGQCKEAIGFFGRMEKSSEKPDGITFLAVLSACAHAGFLKEGLEIFSKMEKYGLTASIKHHGCVIDLLGRAGRIREAYDFMKKMPMKPNDTIWGALLGACRIHSDMEMAEKVQKEVSKQNSETSSGGDSHYVLLSDIFASSHRWEKAERMKMIMSNNGFQKTPGRSAIVLDAHETSLELNA